MKPQMREQMGQISLKTKPSGRSALRSLCLQLSLSSPAPSRVPHRRLNPDPPASSSQAPSSPPVLARPTPCIRAFGRAPREAPELAGRRLSRTRPRPPRSRWRGFCSLAVWHPGHPERGSRLRGVNGDRETVSQ